MTVALLAMIAVLGLAPGADPADLVARLGSPRFAEREAAASALERLGRGALPALRGALGSKDPEVQTRAAELATRIERDLMVRPTTVTLDFRDRPLDEVVRAVADRSGIPVALVPENAALWQGRRVTLEGARAGVVLDGRRPALPGRSTDLFADAPDGRQRPPPGPPGLRRRRPLDPDGRLRAVPGLPAPLRSSSGPGLQHPGGRGPRPVHEVGV
jgi:hypothetical protein